MDIEAKFPAARLDEIRKVFSAMDSDGDGTINREELTTAIKRAVPSLTPADVDDVLLAADADSNGVVDWKEFLFMVYSSENKSGEHGAQATFRNVYKQVKALTFQTSGGVGQHSYTVEEKVSFANHINQTLLGDESVAALLPINPDTEELFERVGSGILLAKLINAAKEETIDERVLVFKPDLNRFQKIQNLNVVLNSAKAIGCTVINITPEDIMEGKPHLILGLTWQIVRIGLLSDINLQNHPELVRLLQPGEDLAALLRLPPEQLLLRWVNYHLAQAGSQRRIANFGKDIKDSEAYTILLNQISRGACDTSALSMEDHTARAERVLENADRLQCRKFVTARDIVNGQPKLNLAFVANLFNNHPALDPPDEAIMREYADLMDFDAEGTREERAYRFWLQNLGLEVNNLFEDVKDGILLLKAFDKIKPGSVDWKRVNMNPRMVFHKGENCDKAIAIGRDCKFSLVGISGTDIVQGNKKLILALVWQMMRYHLVNTIKSLSRGGKDITDKEIVDWANHKVASAGKRSSIASQNDSSLTNGRFLLDLCDALSPGIVNYDIVTAGDTDEDKSMNAKYAISVARAMGVLLFTVWEDLVDCNGKMVLAYLASLMLFERQGAAAAQGGAGASGSH